MQTKGLHLAQAAYRNHEISTFSSICNQIWQVFDILKLEQIYTHGHCIQVFDIRDVVRNFQARRLA